MTKKTKTKYLTSPYYSDPDPNININYYLHYLLLFLFHRLQI